MSGIDSRAGLRTDSHLHVGSLARIEDLVRYTDVLALDHVGVLSLPLAGVTADDTPDATPARPNFNPEVLAAIALRPATFHGYGSFDNGPLVAASDEARAAWDPAAQVAELDAAGFFGVKLWEGKPDLAAILGVALDDARLVAAYREAGARRMPVLIHVADPPIFWDAPAAGSPTGAWNYYGRPVPTFDELIAQAGRACAAAPDTTFIFPHLLFLADDLPRLATFLDRHANAIVDLAPGNYLFPALGAADGASERRAATVAFFNHYARRIMVGSDAFFLATPGRAGAAVPGLPGTSLTNNLERLLRLHGFLATDGRFASPFAPTAWETPVIRGLALEFDVVETICATTFSDLVARRPTTPTAATVADYLDRWAGDRAPLRRHAETVREWIAARTDAAGGGGAAGAGGSGGADPAATHPRSGHRPTGAPPSTGATPDGPQP